jgi:hypothetical protein
MERTTPVAHFTVVRVQKSTIEFATMDDFGACQLAFVVDDETFDAILGRIRAMGLEYTADSNHQRVRELNDTGEAAGSPSPTSTVTNASP